MAPQVTVVASSSRRLKRARARVGGMTERTQLRSPPLRAGEPWLSPGELQRGTTQREKKNGKMMQNDVYAY